MNKLAFFFLIIYSLSFGQDYWMNFNSATSRLPNNSVYAVAIDNEDIKWVATGIGLGRFDGTNWAVYNKFNSGLPNNTVRSVALDSQGNKWLGTDSGLVKFDGKNWTVYTKSNSPLPDNRIRGVAVDKDGFVWCGTKESGVASFDGYNWRLYNASNTTGLVDYINTITVDKNNIKWIGTSGGGLGKFDGVNWTFYTKNSGSACNSFLSVTFDSEGVLWAGTWNGGLESYNGHWWGSYFPPHPPLLPHKWVLAVAVDSKNIKWVGTNNLGFYQFDNGTFNRFDSTNSLIKDTCILSVKIDKYNNKWIGSYTKGLYIYNERGITLKSLGITAPEAGIRWIAGTTQKVTWYSKNISGNVNIKLSFNGGESYPITLAENTPNDGNEDVTVPSNQSDMCRIKIESAMDSTIYGVTPLDFTIIALKAPVLLSPPDGFSLEPSKLSLKWRKTENAEGYTLIVTDDSSFSTHLINDPSLTDTVYQITNLSTEKKCYWKVQARITGGTSPWSEVRSFSILPLPQSPELQLPLNNAVNVGNNPVLSWSSTPYAASYKLNVSEDDQFSTLFFSDSGMTTLSREVKDLKEGMKYYWQVRGKNATGTGPYSAIWNFTTKLGSPDSLKASVTEGKKVRLTWKENINNESGFIIERKLDADFKEIGTVLSDQTSFLDSTITVSGSYEYRVKAFTSYTESDYSKAASITITPVKELKKVPLTFSLEQNYPNPFNPSTKIKYSIPSESYVSLRVFNLLGSEVAAIVNGRHHAGEYEVTFDGSSLPSGIYLYRLEANGSVTTRKFILLK